MRKNQKLIYFFFEQGQFSNKKCKFRLFIIEQGLILYNINEFMLYDIYFGNSDVNDYC